MLTFTAFRLCLTGLVAVLALLPGCRLSSSKQALDRKTAKGLVQGVTVDAPWVRIPAGLSGTLARDAKVFRAYRRLVKGGILRCDAEMTDCVVGPRGRDLVHEGKIGFKATIGLLVADDVSVLRLIDRNTASATVTLRFRPSAVFTEFRPDLIAILEAQGAVFLADQISGDNMATAQFRLSDGKWQLGAIERLGRSGAAFRRVERKQAQPEQMVVNLAQMASVLVSSEDTSAGRVGLKAIDGLVGGSDDNPATEWLSRPGSEGAWIRLVWNAPVDVWEISIHGRSTLGDSIRSGTLTFSDGSSVNVGELPKDGTGVRVVLAPRRITWLQFQVTSSSGPRTGLAEIEVLGAPVSEGDLGAPR